MDEMMKGEREEVLEIRPRFGSYIIVIFSFPPIYKSEKPPVVKQLFFVKNIIGRGEKKGNQAFRIANNKAVKTEPNVCFAPLCARAARFISQKKLRRRGPLAFSKTICTHFKPSLH